MEMKNAVPHSSLNDLKCYLIFLNPVYLPTYLPNVCLTGSCHVCPKGTYEPGKRHWLKVKKDYLNEGAMADTADLVVLGAFYGKGSNG